MSRQQITHHYARLLSRWPVDRLRPENNFQRLLRSRLKAAPPTSKDETKDVNAAYLLLDNALTRSHPIPESIMKPQSRPDHYTALARELDEAPDRTWFQNWVKRMKGMVRMQ